MGSRIRAAFIALCVASIVFGAAATAFATTGGYSVRPGEIDQNDPATRAYFKPVLEPGSSAIHHVVVTNLGPEPLKLLVDAVDGLTGQTSGSVYANRQDPIRKAGEWLSPSQHTIAIAPHAVATVAFTIAVPRDATPGDHLAGIAFENTATNSSSGSFGVKEIVREVVGVLVRVPGPAAQHLTIGTLALQSLPGTSFASVLVDLSNVGQLLCKPELTVTLRAPNGHARTVTRQLDTVLPGDTIAYPLAWPDSLAAGKYTARAATTACGPAAATADVPLVLGAPLNGSQPSNEPARVVHTPNLSLILTIGLALVALFLGLLIGKRRRKDDEQPSTVPASPAIARARFEPPAARASHGLRRIGMLEKPEPRVNETVQARASEISKPEQQRFWP